MERQTLLLDLDDTLVHCNKYFVNVISLFVDWMLEKFECYGTTRQEILQKQLELDTRALQTQGYGTEHFPRSLADTYVYFCRLNGRRPSEKEKKQAFDLGMSVFSQHFEPFPETMETLERLRSDGHHLYLYTAGDETIQWGKIKRWNLDSYFEHRVMIRMHKDTRTLKSIISEHRFDRTKTWMIGNSLRTDILPAMEAGIHSIHIPAPTEWAYNIVDISIRPKGAHFKLSSLHEVPEAIRSYTAQKASSGTEPC